MRLRIGTWTSSLYISGRRIGRASCRTSIWFTQWYGVERVGGIMATVRLLHQKVMLSPRAPRLIHTRP